MNSAGRRASVRRVWPVVLALLLGAWAWTAAPDQWPTGPGELTVTIDSVPVFVHPIELGNEAPIDTATPGGFWLAAPGGFPVDRTITLTLTGIEASEGSAEVRLTLPDGSVELVPIITMDGSTLTALRRPPVDARPVTALLAAVLVLWVTEVWPLHATALLIPVVLVVGGVTKAGPALVQFFDPIIVLFFAGFLMAEAMKRVGLDRMAAVSIVAFAGSGPKQLLAGLIGVSAFMSMWMSNTAAVAVLLPVVVAVTAPLRSEGYKKAAVLGVAYAATIGGVGTIVGTPANALAAKFITDITGTPVSFIDWMGFGLPMVLLFLPVMGAYLWWVGKVDVDPGLFRETQRIARTHRAEAGPMTSHQVQVLAVFLVVVGLWLTQEWHGVSTSIVALGGAVLLMVIGRIEPSDVQAISWPTLLTFGGGLTIGVFMVESGVADHFVTRLDWLGSLPAWVGIGATAVVALLATTLASNTASAAMLIPLAFPLGGLIGVDAMLLVVVIAIASSIDFALVIGTPPTMLAYSTGLFDVKEILRKGSVLDLVGIVLLVTAVIGTWMLLGLV